MSDLEFLLGLLESADPVCVAWEDFEGAHGDAIRVWQKMGFVDQEPGRHPVPCCPYCEDGVPYLLGERCLCNSCGSTVDGRHLLLWPLHVEKFLRWLGKELRLQGGVRRVDENFWQLGTWESQGTVHECFFLRGELLTGIGRQKLAAFRNAVVLYGLSRPKETERVAASFMSLLEILRLGTSLTVIDRSLLLRNCGHVRFDPDTGTITVDSTWFGEVPVGSKEFFLLLCLSQQQDRFVPYADIKHFVLQHTGGKDGTEEATFCHRLKNRIKKEGWVPMIDALLVTTNKRDGYRLRGYVAGLGTP